ncbi:hypothetical protein DI09_1p290 [Mitosporidium daphniae]|uniref:Uncharacterized protein n=1 Tax=Mitosporidium daphniae TaxID=1485682 RepID=A0A098VTL7_9MICR|nr:uncharacterized protein DI09_1p290 [Mitosporidium daphniae]KGG52179.1 hypothetical protein DI09_1p290 [Mitosporidium daphniae]|eukprot:XP_013238606.1 uncharacterized protein DI09_1p290 [Mitosporidium daphniae]
MRYNENVIIALDIFEKSTLWRSVSKLLKIEEHDSSRESFLQVSKLISSGEYRKPLSLLLMQLGYHEAESSSLISRKLLASIILLLFYEQPPESPSSNHEILLAQLKTISRRLWSLLELALNSVSSVATTTILQRDSKQDTYGRKDTHIHKSPQTNEPEIPESETLIPLHSVKINATLLESLRLEIDAYLLLFDKWKASDLHALQYSISEEITSVEKLGQSENLGPEWQGPLQSYSSILECATNKLSLYSDRADVPAAKKFEPIMTGKDLSISIQLKSNPVLARASVLYEIIVQGPQQFIACREDISRKAPSIFSPGGENSEQLIHFRSFHASVVKRIKRALIEIVTIGEASFKCMRLRERTSKGSIEFLEAKDDGESLAGVIEKDFLSVCAGGSISLKDLIHTLRRTLFWLSTLVSASKKDLSMVTAKKTSTTSSLILGEEIRLLSSSMDAFYARQSTPNPDEAMIAERKAFLIAFYKSLEGIFHRTHFLALEHAVSSLILPFISEKSHLQDYFTSAFASAISTFTSTEDEQCLGNNFSSSVELAVDKKLATSGANSRPKNVENRSNPDHCPCCLHVANLSSNSDNFSQEEGAFADTLAIGSLLHKALAMEDLQLETELPTVLWFDFLWIQDLSRSITLWSYVMSSFLLLKESLGTVGQDLLVTSFPGIIENIESFKSTANYFPMERIWREALQMEDAEFGILSSLNKQHPLVLLFSKRITRAIVECGTSLFESLWVASDCIHSSASIPRVMQTGRFLASTSSKNNQHFEWWTNWCTFLAAVQGYDFCKSSPTALPIHSSLATGVSGKFLCERVIYPAAQQAAKRICLHHILCHK